MNMHVMHMYTIHMHIHTHAHTHINIHTHACTHMNTLTEITYTLTCIHTCICIHAHTHINTHTYIYTHTCIHAHTYMHTEKNASSVSWSRRLSDHMGNAETGVLVPCLGERPKLLWTPGDEKEQEALSGSLLSPTLPPALVSSFTRMFIGHSVFTYPHHSALPGVLHEGTAFLCNSRVQGLGTMVLKNLC